MLAIDATNLRVLLTACSATRMQLTERRGDNHDRRPTLLECATLDRQAHRARPQLSRRRQYRAWVSLYTSYGVFTCIASSSLARGLHCVYVSLVLLHKCYILLIFMLSIINPRRACAEGLRYLSCLCVCLSVCLSV